MTDKPSRYFAAEAELHEAAVTYAEYPEPGEHNRDALLVAAVAYAHAVAELVPPDACDQCHQTGHRVAPWMRCPVVAARAEPVLSFTEREADRNARGGS